MSALVVAAVAAGGLLVLYQQLKTPITPAIVARPQQPAAPPVQPLPSQPEPQSAPATPESTKAVQPAIQVENKKTSVPQAPKTVARKSATPRHHVAAAASARKAAPSSPPVAQKKPARADRATIDAYLFAARSAESRRDYAQAYREYKKANEADPGNYRIMNNLASTALHIDMDTEALGYAAKALAVKPDYVSALINGGIASIRLGNESGAKTMFRKALEVDPLNRKALYNLALLQERENSLDDASATYKRLKEIGDSSGYLGLGRIYERKGMKSEALRVYRDLLGLSETGQNAGDLARTRISALE